MWVGVLGVHEAIWERRASVGPGPDVMQDHGGFEPGGKVVTQVPGSPLKRGGGLQGHVG